MWFLVVLVLVGTAMAGPTPYLANLDERTVRVVGGRPTTIEQYPFMANMRRLGNFGAYSQSCGGSLISRSAVVTAAHCTYGDASLSWRVRLGTSLRNQQSGSDYTLTRIINHEYYDRPLSLNNDVSVVFLRESVVFGATIQPIKLAGKNYDLPDNAIVTTIGWGALASGGGFPDQLQEVDINVIPQEICAERYEALKENPVYEAWPNITEAMICAGILDVGGADACQGDSGGPLIHHEEDGDVLVGIVSWGFGCADPVYPGVNARVSALAEWIALNASS
ncbi:trypsin domain-containing protein [Phthorimaea operculella]|nr:trypsin domain-containing protein [Phthorimaea operculella]